MTLLLFLRELLDPGQMSYLESSESIVICLGSYKIMTEYIKPNKEMKEMAWQLLKAFVDESGDAEAQTALATVRPSLYGIGNGGRPNKTWQIINFIVENSPVSSLIVFEKFHVGRNEMSDIIRRYLRSCQPEARVWIAYLPDTMEYILIGNGPEPPGDYQGYIPK